MTAPDAFRAAREFLLRHREDYDAAYRDFRWPALDRFNWALDYFDGIARDNSSTALHVVEDDGTSLTRTFAEMSERSTRVADFLSRQGVRRGDRILIMLGNVPELWETVLAAIKLGAVFSPATLNAFEAEVRTTPRSRATSESSSHGVCVAPSRTSGA